MFNTSDIIEIIDTISGETYVYEIELDYYYDDDMTLSGLGPTLIEI